MCILVVDDDDGLRQLLHAQLSELGYTVDTAVDGVEALCCLMNRSYEIIVTDLDMPGLDGASLWRHALGTGYAGKWIMITGDRTDPRCPHGRLPVLEKPFRIQALIETIQRVRSPSDFDFPQDEA